VDRRRNLDKGWSHRDIGTREIGILEVVRIGTSEISNQRKNLSRPSVGMRGRRSMSSGKGQRGSHPSKFGSSGIGYRRSREQRVCAFQNRETRFPDKA
jgi:hypothetical protein